MKISSIKARQILDSRGNPTIEADVFLENGIMGRSAVPSGASTGKYEAVELRDGTSAYDGKSVLNAVKNVSTSISDALKGIDVTDQHMIDKVMIDLDGTKNKGKLGANAILGVSMASTHAAALSLGIPLYEYYARLGNQDTSSYNMPVPLMNIMNGGKHAAGSTDIQEFMIAPVGANSFSHALQMGAEIFHALGSILHAKGYATTVGDEGGYAPHLKQGNKEALDLISEAVEKAHYKLGTDIVYALDVAASELYTQGNYILKTENKTLYTLDLVSWYEQLVKTYPIVSIEDGLDQEDWNGWKDLTSKLGSTTQLVGDDLLVTNIKFIEKAIQEKAANAVLVKLNQIGTVSETLDAVATASKANWNSIISHRSGETEDTTISHVVVGLKTGQIKTGSLSRSERIAKYNELLRIEEQLGSKAIYIPNIK